MLISREKMHNKSRNSPFLSHNLPWKCHIISDLLSHSIREPVFISVTVTNEAM